MEIRGNSGSLDFASMNVISTGNVKSRNIFVQPPHPPTPILPTLTLEKVQKIHTKPRNSAHIENSERGLPLARARETSQLHTPPFLTSDCQTDTGSRPSLCSAQPGQPITARIELFTGQEIPWGTVIGRRHAGQQEKTSEPSF